jgi:hypothetical protein
MAVPVIATSGTAASTASATTLDVPYPSGIATDDFLFCSVVDGSGHTVPNTPSGWSATASPLVSGAVRKITFYRDAIGSESGNLTLTGLTNGNSYIARMYRISGKHLIEDGASNGNQGTSKTPGHPDVTTTDVDRLVLVLGGVDDNETASSFTGETGGDLTLHSQDGSALGNDALLYLQTADMATSGTISGGTWTYTGATENWAHNAFAVYADATGFTLATDAGSYALTGVDASLEYGFALDTAAGSYSVSGVDVTLQLDIPLAVDAGSYSVSGVDATLLHDFTLDTAAGSYSLSGVDVGLSKGFILDTAAGAYSVSGVDASLEHGFALDTEAGSYALSGVDVNLEYGFALDTEAGAYSLSGVDANLEYGYALATTAGSYVLSGADVDLIYSGTDLSLATEAGSYSVSGVDANLEYSRIFATSAGSYLVTGADVTLTIAAADGEISGHHPLPPYHHLRRRHRTSNAWLEEQRRQLRALEAAKKKAEDAERAKVTAQRQALAGIRADLKRADLTKQIITSDIAVIYAELKKRKAEQKQRRVMVAFEKVAKNLQTEISEVEYRIEAMERQKANENAIAALLLAA